MVLTRGCDAVGQSCTPSHLRPHAPSLCPHLAPGFLQAPLVLRPAPGYKTSAQNSMATTYMRAAQQSNHEQLGAPSLTWGGGPCPWHSSPPGNAAPSLEHSTLP